MVYILYKLVMKEPIPYIDNRERFRVSAWDGRSTDLKKCLNNIEGIRHYIYPEFANECYERDTFNKYL